MPNPFARDLILLHPPAIYDFRTKPTFLGPVADAVPSTAMFEMYPVGLTSIAAFLESNHYNVEIVNLAYRMLHDAAFDVAAHLGRMSAPVFGVDLHWLPHVQGALSILELVKRLHPGSRTLADHQQAFLRNGWHQILSYETSGMTREEIVRATYDVADRLNDLKHAYGVVDDRMFASVKSRLSAARRILEDPEAADGPSAELTKHGTMFGEDELKWPVRHHVPRGHDVAAQPGSRSGAGSWTHGGPAPRPVRRRAGQARPGASVDSSARRRRTRSSSGA